MPIFTAIAGLDTGTGGGFNFIVGEVHSAGGILQLPCEIDDCYTPLRFMEILNVLRASVDSCRHGEVERRRYRGCAGCHDAERIGP